MINRPPPEVRCPVCRVDETLVLLQRRQVPVHQNLLMPSRRAAEEMVRGDLDLRFCAACGFGFNAAFRPELLAYGADYDNTQLCSPRFDQHVDRLIEHLVQTRGIRNCRIVEVGCGQGEFLRRLTADPCWGNTGIGFDPSYRGPDRDPAGRFEARREFYTADVDAAADVVICRHVIEHVPRPMELLETIAASLSRSPGQQRVCIETPALEWILEHEVVWDLFYEHCSLFTADSLTRALQWAGFGDVRVRRIFGGQYLWAEAQLGAAAAPQRAEQQRLKPIVRRFADRVTDRLEHWMQTIAALRESGEVAVWGAGAKGVTFCHLCDPDCETIDAVIDINPAKRGRFIPGTGHGICAPEDWRPARPGRALVLNPNYFREIRETVQQSGSQMRAVNLMKCEVAV